VQASPKERARLKLFAAWQGSVPEIVRVRVRGPAATYQNAQTNAQVQGTISEISAIIGGAQQNYGQ